MARPISDRERLEKLLRADPNTLEQVDAILDGRSKFQTSNDDDQFLVSVTQAARLLSCSRTSIWRMRRQGVLDAIRLPAGGYRLRRSQVEAIAKRGDGK